MPEPRAGTTLNEPSRIVLSRKWLILRNASSASGKLHLSGCNLFISFCHNFFALSAVASAPVSLSATHTVACSVKETKWSISAWSVRSVSTCCSSARPPGPDGAMIRDAARASPADTTGEKRENLVLRPSRIPKSPKDPKINPNPQRNRHYNYNYM